MVINRRRIILEFLSATACISLSAKAAQSDVIVGAIRWDPWYEPTDAGERATMEYVLDPEPWRSRAPQCATINRGRLDFSRCSAQQQIDKEIAEAHSGGIYYWAFCWYGVDSPMQQAWRFYKNSTLQPLINWCLIVSTSNFISEKSSSIVELATLMRDPSYQKVLFGRPLLYLI